MYDVPVTTSEKRGVRYNMAIFEIQQVVLVRPPFKERVWAYEDSYDESFEYTESDEWIPSEKE